MRNYGVMILDSVTEEITKMLNISRLQLRDLIDDTSEQSSGIPSLLFIKGGQIWTEITVNEL